MLPLLLCLVQPIHENCDTQLGEELDEVGDPPRVWLSSLDKPGCAFTRCDSYDTRAVERLCINVVFLIGEACIVIRKICINRYFCFKPLTRSLGDSIGERVGVFAEPEQFVVNVTQHDRAIVIASDGVFEFITNYNVCIN